MTGAGSHGSGMHHTIRTVREGIELGDPARLRALEHLGLTADADERMDELADWVREALGVPVALVSLVHADVQVFPGMVGLPEPWASKRSTPLSHSFCQHVVRTAEPLVVTDAREHPMLQGNLAVPELGVVAYAGMPLTDEDGRVLGSLCAIDTEPRRWTDSDLTLLRRIAAACAAELRLRLARHDAYQEELRRDEVEAAQRRAFDRTQMLLGVSQAFTATITTDDVRARIRDLLSSDLHPHVVGAGTIDEQGRWQRLDDVGAPALLDRFGPEARTPATTAVREARIVHYPNRRAFDADHPPEAQAVLRRLGVHELVAVPLPGPHRPVGALVLAWELPGGLESSDLLTIASIAGYAGQAFTRADTLGHRITVAHELQSAMLTTLPAVDGLQMAARYEAADSRENVGGDWYDAVPVVDSADADRGLAVSVGDIMGHTLGAATIMGQVRSMLRQSAWDHPGGSPSAILRAFETASLGLGLAAAGTAIVAQLCPVADDRWTLVWTNAGHPPPILLLPDGTADLLDAHDALFGFPFSVQAPRSDHRRTVEPGSTLFLYTDGLVERRGSDIDAGTERFIGLLRRIADQPVAQIVATTVDTLAPDAPDDVVAFAVRFPRR
jgi:GAF domain-containing protein